MIKKIFIFNLLTGLAFFGACSSGSGGDGNTVVSIAAISGVTAPVYGETPVTAITSTAQYTGTVTWSGSPETFEAETAYTATITLTAQSGYTFTGMDADFFTVADADTVTNTAGTGVVTAVFPATDEVTFDNVAAIGDTVSITIGPETAGLNYASDGTSITFPAGEDDDGTSTISSAFFMARTETTYALWYEVYTWATDTSVDHDGDGLTYDDDGDADYYTFASAGCEGHNGTLGAEPTSGNTEPVTTINWRDALVWCNALTEYYNDLNSAGLNPVYYTDSDYVTPLRTATDSTTITNTTAGSQDYPYIYAASTGNTDIDNCTADGFRLPTSDEWEYAARYTGTSAPSDSSVNLYTEYVSLDHNDDGTSSLTGGYYWTPGDYASGATADTSDSDATGNVAWYSANASSTTHNAAQKTANALGLFDMSGNVWEWAFDWHPDWIGSRRVVRSGCYTRTASYMRAGYFFRDDSYSRGGHIGFRFAKTR
jgi:formylglycine-generating enzyme required for sulfatase activity